MFHHLVKIISGEGIKCGLPEGGCYPNDVENQKACPKVMRSLSHGMHLRVDHRAQV